MGFWGGRTTVFFLFTFSFIAKSLSIVGMSLLKCPECGHDVSSYAKACPNCGCPMEEIKNLLATQSVSDVAPVSSFKETSIPAPNSESSQASGAQRFYQSFPDWRADVVQAIIHLSKRLSYLPPLEHLTDANYRYALRNESENKTCRLAFEALHGYSYRRSLEHLKSVYPFKQLTYCTVPSVNDEVAKRIWKEYKAYKVIDFIHKTEKAFNEKILEDERVFVGDFVSKNPADAEDVSNLSGLNSNYQDAVAMVQHVFEGFNY